MQGKIKQDIGPKLKNLRAWTTENDEPCDRGIAITFENNDYIYELIVPLKTLKKFMSVFEVY